MSSEDKDLLAKISQLAGQINRHKSQQPVSQPTSDQRQIQSIARGRHSSRGPRGYSRGVRKPVIHRNRTLVLNNGSGTPDEGATSASSNTGSGAELATGNSAWVSKTDRHLQLINSSVFEREKYDRAKAIERSRQLKLKQRNEREKAKFSKFLQYQTTHDNHTIAPSYQITVQGVQFLVGQDGSKLIKLPGNENAGRSTPRTAIVGGVTFYRSKSGNMYRAGIVKAQRQRTVRKKDELCKVFTTTGSCPKGPRCPYVHDASKVAVCRSFLQKGECSAGQSCDLSHELTPERIPTCLHFTRGNCSNDRCPYAHVHVSPSAPVCRPFGIYGYCAKGEACAERHIMNECPDFSNTGVCNTKGCKLIHRDKASVIRRNGLEGVELDSDLSSDNETDSDDVDSDDLEGEWLGAAAQDEDIPLQKDFVQL